MSEMLPHHFLSSPISGGHVAWHRGCGNGRRSLENLSCSKVKTLGCKFFLCFRVNFKEKINMSIGGSRNAHLRTLALNARHRAGKFFVLKHGILELKWGLQHLNPVLCLMIVSVLPGVLFYRYSLESVFPDTLTSLCVHLVKWAPDPSSKCMGAFEL